MTRKFQVFMIVWTILELGKFPAQLVKLWKEKRKEIRWNTAGSSENVTKKITSSVAEKEDSEKLSFWPIVAH